VGLDSKPSNVPDAAGGFLQNGGTTTCLRCDVSTAPFPSMPTPVQVDVTSLLHSLTRILANKKRKVALSPGFINLDFGQRCSVLLIAADLGTSFWGRGVIAFGPNRHLALIEAGACTSSREKSLLHSPSGQ
jgi:hypothetical protein